MKKVIAFSALLLLVVTLGCNFGMVLNDPAPPASDRTTIAELENIFVSTVLYSNVKNSNPTLVYADEITSINDVFNISIISLEGMEYLVNLESLTMVYTGINSVALIQPILGLTHIQELVLIEDPSVEGTDVETALRDALVNCLSFIFE